LQAMFSHLAGKRKGEIVNNFEAIDKLRDEREDLAITKSSLLTCRLW